MSQQQSTTTDGPIVPTPSAKVRKKTAYLFYSEKGLDDQQQARLKATGAMYSDSDKLTSYLSLNQNVTHE